MTSVASKAPDDVIRLTYLIETATGEPEALAAKIASDQSTGTFVPLPGETPELKARVAARVVAVRELPPAETPSFPQDRVEGLAAYRRAEADIDFPLDAVGTDLAALMTIAIGGVYSIKGLSGIRVVGLHLPPAFGKAHPGPQFGTPGTRRLTGRVRPPDHRLDRQARAWVCAHPRRPRWSRNSSRRTSTSSRTTRS